MGIELKNITKRFGDTLALNNINLNFDQPKIYGLLGNNGAGKNNHAPTLSPIAFFLIMVRS